MNYINLFSKVVLENADKIAIVDQNGKRSTTYKELDILSDRVSGKLKSLNVNIGDFVVLEMSRRMEYVAASLGVMKVGAVVVPLSNDYPEVRKKYIEENCNAKAVITDDFFDDIDKYEKNISLADDKSKVMLFYTSGSTGNPKGVIYGVDSFANIMVAQKVFFNDSEKSETAGVAPFYFVVSVTGTYPVLLLGKMIHIMPEKVRTSIDDLFDYYTKNNIASGYMPIQVLKILKDTKLPLKVIHIGGEQVSGIYSKYSSIRNIFGQTESMSGALYFDIDKEYENTPIGKPISGVKAYICDEDGNEVEDGKEGEICIEGPYDVEYFKDEEKTKKTFVKLDNGMTVIHTGDIGKKDENGNVVYISRKDWMVKVNGQRVEMPEVEHQMMHIEGVKNAVVTSFVDNNKQTYIVGYYQTESGISEEVVKKELAKKLPHYMVPRYIVELNELPKNINGKLDRKALKPPKIDDIRAEYVAPTNEIEKLICDTFAKVLGIDKVGINDDFIALGGDSITSMRFVELCPLDQFTVNDLFKYKTAKELAEYYLSNYVNKKEDIDKKNKEALAKPQKVYQQIIDVIENQLLEPDSVIWNIPILLKLKSNIDIEKFAKTVDKVLKNHPSLSSIFLYDDKSNILQKYNSELYKNIQIVEITEESLLQNTKKLIRPFKCIGDILHRKEIYKTENGYYFFMDIHHLISDGTSLNIILNEISNCYNDINYKMPTDYYYLLLSEYENSFKNINQEEVINTYESLSKKMVDSKNYSIMPKVDFNVINGTNEFYTNEFTIDKKFFVKNEFIKDIDGNVFFSVACALAIAKYNNTKYAGLEWVYNGRDNKMKINSCGLFLKYNPLYVIYDDDDSIEVFYKKMKKQINYEIANSIVRYIVWLNTDKTDCLFLRYQKDIKDMLKFNFVEDEIKIDCRDKATANFFAVEIIDSDNSDKFSCSIEYTSSCYKKESIERFFKTYDEIVTKILSIEDISNYKIKDL